MGMYTRFTFWAEVRPDCEALPILQHLANPFPATEPPEEWPSHEFFESPRFDSLMVCSSYYHQTSGSQFAYDDIAKAWMLNIDSSLKNYDGEIEKFLAWFAPFDSGHAEFRGFYLYEEDDYPTLIHRTKAGPDGLYAFVPTGEPATA